MKQANLDLSVIEKLMESPEPLTEEQREWVTIAAARTRKLLSQLELDEE